MNVELVAQMFKNYRSNVLFHLEGENIVSSIWPSSGDLIKVTYSNGQPSGTFIDDTRVISMPYRKS